MKKKHFDIFKRLQENKRKNYKKNSLDIVVKEQPGYEYIPPWAYIELWNEPGYSHLKDGLYIGHGKMIATDDVKEVCSDFKDISEYDNYEIVKEFDWHDSKKIVSKLDKHMLTPAEFFCTMKYVKALKEEERDMAGNDLTKIKKYQVMWMDLCYFGDEWLDAIIEREIIRPENYWKRKAYIKTHTQITETVLEGKTYRGGNKYILPELTSGGKFDSAQVDPVSGFPGSHASDLKGDFHYTRQHIAYTFRPKSGAFRGYFIEKDTQLYTPSIHDMIDPNEIDIVKCIRLCKKIEKDDILEDRRTVE